MKHGVRVAIACIVLLVQARLGLAQHEGHQMGGGSTGDGACLAHAKESLGVVESANRRLEEARQTNSPQSMRAAMDDLQGALAEVKTHLSLCASPGSSPTEGGAMSPMPGVSSGMEMMDHSKMGHEMDAPKNPSKPSKASPSSSGMEAMDHSKMGHSASPPASPTHDMGTMDHSKMSMPGVSSSPKSPPTSGAKRSSETKQDHSRMNMPGMSKESQPKSGSSIQTDLNQPPTRAKTKDPVCGKEVTTQAAEKATYQGKTYYFCSRADREKFLSDPAPYVNR